MRILQNPAQPALSSAPATVSERAIPPARETERLETFDKIIVTLIQRIQALETKLEALERPTSTQAPKPAFCTVPSFSGHVTVDSAALKKGLLVKMWQYLNDEPPPKAI